MTIGELKIILNKYPDFDVCIFDDNADEYGDSEGNVKIHLYENAVENYPLEDGRNFVYIELEEQITAI